MFPILTYFENCFRADNMREKKKKHLERCQRSDLNQNLNQNINLRFTLVYNPILAMGFVTVYWAIGLFHAYSV